MQSINGRMKNRVRSVQTFSAAASELVAADGGDYSEDSGSGPNFIRSRYILDFYSRLLSLIR